MPSLKFDQVGEKYYEAGTKKCALFVIGNDNNYGNGIAWNGITGLTVSNTGGDETALWADDIKYASLTAAEECGGTIEAYQCPPEFYPCDGIKELAPGVYVGQQNRSAFGLAFVTTIGNDTQKLEYGHKLHLVYGANAQPSERAYATINDSPDAMTLSWEFTTTPVQCAGCKPVAHLEIDSRTVDATKLAAFEAIVFGQDADTTAGTEDKVSRLPLPNEVATFFATTTTP